MLWQWRSVVNLAKSEAGSYWWPHPAWYGLVRLVKTQVCFFDIGKANCLCIGQRLAPGVLIAPPACLLSAFYLIVLETGSLTEPGVHQFGYTDWLLSSQGSVSSYCARPVCPLTGSGCWLFHGCWGSELRLPSLHIGKHLPAGIEIFFPQAVWLW